MKKYIMMFFVFIGLATHTTQAMNLTVPKAPLYVFDAPLVDKMAVATVLFTSIYALADLSNGVCTKASLAQALKDGLITSAVLTGSLALCNELPGNSRDCVWLASIGLAPTLLTVHSLLLKRAMGLQNYQPETQE